ncbi:MAG TPA: hypothetical protein VGE04_18475 [Chloroflexia bacterium]
MLRAIRFWAALGATLVVLALLLSGSSAQAKPNQPKPPKPPKTPEAVITATGMLVVETADGKKSYLLKNGSGATLYRLSAGPPWYYANGAYPLDKYANQQVTVRGVVEAKNGNGNGKAKNKGNAAAQQPQSTVPELEVYAINGETIRGPGKPPWAGGPKNNPNHPGNNGNGHKKNKNPNVPKP